MMALILSLLVIAGILGCAFYAGFEMGFYSLNDIRLAHRVEDGHLSARILNTMKSRPEAFIITILIGNNLTSYLASSAMTGLCDMQRLIDPTLLTSVILTPVAFLIGETVPKRLFHRFPHKLCYNPFIIALYIVSRTVYFIPVFAINEIGALIAKLAGSKKTRYTISVNRQRLKDVFGGRRSRIPALLEDMAVTLIDNARRPIRDMMIPLSECTLIHADATMDDFVELSMKTHRSRIPIYDDDLQKPIGIADLFSVLNMIDRAESEHLTVRDLAKSITVAAAQTTCYDALKIMQRNHDTLIGVGDSAGNLVGLLPISTLTARIALPLGTQTSKIISPELRTRTHLRQPITAD